MSDKPRRLDAMIGRMCVEHIADLSDAEIVRTLSPCVCGERLVKLAKQYRDEGVLTMFDIVCMEAAHV